MEKEIIAKLRYLRMSPRKVRLVAGLIRGTDVENAKSRLMFCEKKAAEHILKLLNSAIANAKNNFSKTEGLYVTSILVDQGPTYKRFRPRAKGMAGPINKKTSHITIILDERSKEGVLRGNEGKFRTTKENKISNIKNQSDNTEFKK